MKKIHNMLSALVIMFILSVLVVPVSAHVSVKPAEIGVGARSNFVVSVPTEEDVPTTQVRLVVPEGIKSVSPNVAPGWNIQLIKTGEGDAERVSEVIWSGGSIGVDLRNEFAFSAQAPANEAALSWKAYQTYANGIIVAWDTDPKTVEEYSKANPVPAGTHDENAPKPYSVTKVVNDLAASSVPAATEKSSIETKEDKLPLLISFVAVALAVTSLVMQRKAKKE